MFSIWHPELVSLRLSLGHARHPAQVVVSGTGNLPVERGLMFTEPTLRVFIVTRSSSVAKMRNRLAGRPWVEVIDAGAPLSLTIAMDGLHQRGLEVISAVGGRRTATALLREGLVSDLYLTTSPVVGGEPHTPLYEGLRLALSRVIAKAGQGTEAGVPFRALHRSARTGIASRRCSTRSSSGWNRRRSASGCANHRRFSRFP